MTGHDVLWVENIIHHPDGWSPALIQTAHGAGIRSEGYGLPKEEGYWVSAPAYSLPLWGRWPFLAQAPVALRRARRA